MSKCNVNKVALQLIENAFWQECSPADLLHIFRTLFYKNSYHTPGKIHTQRPKAHPEANRMTHPHKNI